MSNNRTIPNSLYEKYMEERVELYNILWDTEAAISALVSGNCASYSLGNRSCTYQDIDKLKVLRNDTENRINELEAILRGASVRNVQVSTFLDPSICIPRR